MKKLLLLLLLIPQLLIADAVIFSGNDVKTLKPNIDLFGSAKILTTTVDPSSSGLVGPIGSIALRTTTGVMYLKTSAPNTGWTKNLSGVVSLTADVSGILPVTNGGTGNSTGTATINANLTGMVTSVGNAASLGSFSSSNLLTALTDETGTGSAVFSTSPTLITPALGTPTALVGTNITGTASGLTAGNVTTNANLTGGVTSVGNAATVITNANLTGDVTSVGNATSYSVTVPLNKGGTGQTTKAPAFDALSPMTTGGDIIYGGASGTGTRLANGSAGTFLQSNGTTLAPTWTSPSAGNLTGAVTSTGLATVLGSFSSSNLLTALTDETGTGAAVFAGGPTFTGSPVLSTPSATSLVIGGTINANAVLDVQSTTKAFIPPRMTHAQMLAISTPTTGMMVYDTDFLSPATYNGSAWTYGFTNLNLDNVYSSSISSTAVVTKNNITGWVASASVASTSTYTLVVPSGTFTIVPNCVASPTTDNRINADFIVASSTATSLVFRTTDSNTDGAVASPFNIVCQKQGADYLSSSSSVYAISSASTIALATDFSAQVDATGAVTGENLDWINSSCTNANPTVCTFNSSIFTLAPNCTTTASNTSAILALTTPVTSTSGAATIQQNSTITATREPFTIHCQKSGVDYTNAVHPFIVASLAGVPQTGYSGGVDTFSVSMGTTDVNTVCTASPCFISQIGTGVSSITRVGVGDYVMNFSKTYSKVMCVGWAALLAANQYPYISPIFGSSISTKAFTINRADSAAQIDNRATFYCMGSY